MNGQDWDIDRYILEVQIVRNTMDSWSPEEFSFEAIRQLIEHFPLKHKAATFTLLQSGYRAHELKKHELDLQNIRAEAQERMVSDKQIREWKREGRAFWVGVALLLIALAVSILVPSVNSSASLLLRVTAGIAVALIIAFLPGLFSVDASINIKKSKVVLRATGGLAGFLVIYLFNPGWISALIHLPQK